MKSRVPVGVPRSAVLAALLWIGAPALAQDEPPFDERAGNVFFHSPDRDTERRIERLIGRFAEDSVRARTEARRELEDIGYWSVQPLLDAMQFEEPPIRAAAALTLSAVLDPRAVEPMRAAIERETSHPFVAGFAALGLARYRDAGAIEPLRVALKSSKSIHTLRAAAPLTLARIRTPEALALLNDRLRSRVGNGHVKQARMLALGFFPQAALDPGGPDPSAALRKGLRAKQRDLRRAAMVGYLVATLHRNDTRDVLMGLLDREKDAHVLVPGLIGLSRFEGPATTAYLSHRAARSSEDELVRVQCCDLLTGRGDPAALPDLLAILRRSSSARMRASAILAIGGIDHGDAATAILDRLGDKSPLVRAAAAVAAVRMPRQDARDEALRRIDTRLRAGEPSREARHDLTQAREVLAGEREVAEWREVGAETLFAGLYRPYRERLLREVNRVAKEALDLAKIRDLQVDADVMGDEGPGDTGDGGEGDPIPPGGSPTPVDDQPAIDPPSGPKAPAVGSPRIATWQELHDLKVDLVRRPLFVAEDLPEPTTTR